MTKKELRVLLKRKRSLLTTDQVNDLSSKCFSHLLKHFDLKNKKVGLFLPIIDSNEPNTFLLYNELVKLPAKTFFPVTNLGALSIDFYSLSSLSNLSVSNYGIPEPNEMENKIPPDLLDVLIVPLLAINKKGYRVGYGKGLYDSFIPLCKKNTCTIGISLFNEVFEIDDLNDFDIPLNHCVFPDGIKKYSQSYFK